LKYKIFHMNIFFTCGAHATNVYVHAHTSVHLTLRCRRQCVPLPGPVSIRISSLGQACGRAQSSNTSTDWSLLSPGYCCYPRTRTCPSTALLHTMLRHRTILGLTAIGSCPHSTRQSPAQVARRP
jgi:hypothetical protein